MNPRGSLFSQHDLLNILVACSELGQMADFGIGGRLDSVACLPVDSGSYHILEKARYLRKIPALKKELDLKWSLDNSGPRELSFRRLAVIEKIAQPPNADGLGMRHLQTERINRVFSRNRSSGLAGENKLRRNLDRTRRNLAQR